MDGGEGERSTSGIEQTTSLLELKAAWFLLVPWKNPVCRDSKKLENRKRSKAEMGTREDSRNLTQSHCLEN